MTNSVTGSKDRGFTIVELSLVMVFMSVLLLAILYLTISAGNLYVKGVTNKTLNQINRDIADSMKRDFQSADTARVMFESPGAAGKETGRLCVGGISYVWNSAALAHDSASVNKIKGPDGVPISLVRVSDASASMCTPSPGGTYPMQLQTNMAPEELLNGRNRNYAVYSASYTSLAESEGRNGLYRLTLTIGTNEKDTVDEASGQVLCKPPSSNTSNFEYCTVSEMTMILRTGGEQR